MARRGQPFIAAGLGVLLLGFSLAGPGALAQPASQPAPQPTATTVRITQPAGGETYTVRTAVSPAEVYTDGAWRPARPGDAVEAGDRLRTGQGGRIELSLAVNAVLQVRPETEVVLGERLGRPLVAMERGEVQFGVKGTPPQMMVATPYYLVTRLLPGTSTVRENTFQAQSPADFPSYIIYQGRVVTIPPGERYVAIDKPATPPADLLSEGRMLVTGENGVLQTVPLPGLSPSPSPGAQAPPSPGPEGQPTPAAAPVSGPPPAMGELLQPPLPPLTVPPRDIGGSSPTSGSLQTTVQ